MVAKITSGIRVSVETQYQPDYSNPKQGHFVFTYQVTIENTGSQTAQLISRVWNIWDSNGEKKQIEGEGVVGRQPVIEPGQSYQYVSGCNLKTTTGKMSGLYHMQRTYNEEPFDVTIPEFTLIVPYLLN